MKKTVAGTFRRAAWGCYGVVDLIDERTALCFDYEGRFEKAVAEIESDAEIPRSEFRETEDKRSALRFSESLRLWGEDIAKLLSKTHATLVA